MLKPLSFYRTPKSSVQEFKSHKVPDAIVNWVGPNSKRERPAPKETQAPTKSLFLITLNTNLGYKRFDQAGRIKLAEHLYDTMNEFGEGLKSGEFFKCASIKGQTYDCQNVEVEEYEFSTEIGNKKGHVHSHAKIICNGVTHIDTGKCNTFFETAFREYHSESSGKPYVNVKSFPNTEAIIDAYIQKEQNSLTPQQFGNVSSDNV